MQACEENRIYFTLPCNPYDGSDLTKQDITNIELYIKHETYDDEGVSLGFVTDLYLSQLLNAGSFDTVTPTRCVIIIDPALTATMPAGTLEGKIFLTTIDGTWLEKTMDVCLERETLAPPAICVTGPAGGETPFNIAGKSVQMWFHESDPVHHDRTYDRFVVDWGDGNADILSVAVLQPASTAWTLAHTYTLAGDYDITVTGYLNTDTNDPCDPELKDCQTAKCVRIV